ncbi:MAG TPA: serine/threonine-protein kinase [Gemmata sp.]|nr:serine/threonine-protein kinase [Gemmata sp.]
MEQGHDNFSRSFYGQAPGAEGEDVSDEGLTPRMNEEDQVVARSLSLRGVHPPVKVPGYEQEEFLGHGAYGEVWIAVNRNSGRKVAIKFYTRRGGLDWASLAREVEKLRYLFSDRYVVQLFEVGWESDPPYYVMEFMENGSLEDLLRAGQIPVHDAVGYFREIAIALVHAHNKGILHCDLKPGNVLLDQDRRPRLADFGQSRLTNEMSPALGTLFYMAPEQADLIATPDARWDVYALGAVMYRMLTGHPPYYQSEPMGGNLEAQLAAYRKLILSSPKPTAHRTVPGVDNELAGIIDRCLATSPGKRVPNPQAVVTAIDAWSLRRVRRPLLFLMSCGVVVLLLVTTAIGGYLFKTSVNTAQREVIDRALEGNRFAAKSEARQFGLQIQFRWSQLESAARDPNLCEGLLKGDQLKADPKACQLLDTALSTRKERSDQQFDETDQSSLWFVDDAAGFQRADAPEDDPRRHLYRGYRDYFHGLGRELDDKIGPPPAIIHAPYRSMVFHRSLDSGEGFWSVAFSVPIWDDPNEHAHHHKPIGVVGMFLDLKGHTRVAGERERFAVLIDTHADSQGKRGLIVRHPYLERTAPGSEPQLAYAEDVVRWSDSGGEFSSEEDYRDPVGGSYSGDWLASVERVMVRLKEGNPVDTGWVILVQERRNEVLSPVRDLEWRLSFGGLGATLFILILLAGLSVGVMSLLEGAPKSRVTRLLRRWAGLSTSGATGTSATGTPVISGGKTAHAGSGVSTPGTAPKTSVDNRSNPKGPATPR